MSKYRQVMFTTGLLNAVKNLHILIKYSFFLESITFEFRC